MAVPNPSVYYVHTPAPTPSQVASGLILLSPVVTVNIPYNTAAEFPNQPLKDLFAWINSNWQSP